MTSRDRAEALLAGPTACAFLLLVDANGLAPAEAARPPLAFALAAHACHATDPWGVDDIERETIRVRERAQSLRPMAEAFVEGSDASWWWSDLDRQHQEVREPRHRIELTGTDRSSTSNWAAYAQRSNAGAWTSTVFGGTSGLAIATASGVGDLDPDEAHTFLPATISAEARVFDVHDPTDWHALAVRFPTESAYDDRIEPDWSEVASTFDVVHLSFAGLLTARWTDHRDARGLSRLWTWEAESSHVLNEAALGDPIALAVTDLDTTSNRPAERSDERPGPFERDRPRRWFSYARDGARRR